MADDDATKADDATTDEQPASDSAAEGKDSKDPKEPKERRTLAVPAWGAGVLAAILLLGVGFAIGWVSNGGGGRGHDRMEIGRRFPGPGARGPRGPQDGQLPQNRPFPQLPQQEQNQQNQTQASGGAFLGVQVEDANGNQNGASVAAVEPGSPADDSGIQQGDVITAVDGNNVDNAAQLAARIGSHSAGDTVTITVTRNGRSHDVDVTLGASSSSNLPNLPGLPNGGSGGGSNSVPGLPGLPNTGSGGTSSQ